jgi:hypothetical protein
MKTVLISISILLCGLAGFAQVNIRSSKPESITISPDGIHSQINNNVVYDSTNIVLGQDAFRLNGISKLNIAIGKKALNANITNSLNSQNSNIAIGHFSQVYSGSSNFLGSSNVSIGNFSLSGYNYSFSNLAIGESAMYMEFPSVHQPSSNTVIGNSAFSNTYGNRNVAVGQSSLYSSENVNNSVAVGFSALENSSGSSNTAVGNEAGNLSNGSGNLFLGNQAGKNQTVNNQLFISNTNTANPLIWGDFNSGILTVHGKLGIDTKSPNQKLQIDNGGIRLRNTVDNKNWEWNYDETNNYAYFDELGVGRKLFLRNGPNPLVGIGVNPTYNLHVKSNLSQTQLALDNQGGGMFFTAKIDEGIINQTAGRFSIRTGDLERLTIFENSSRLAINMPLNSTPSGYSLDVYDGFSLINSSIRIRPSAWQANSMALLSLGDENHYIKGTHSVGMQIHDVNKIKITGSNVGIGDSDPDAKLEVDGYTMLGSDAPKIKNKYFQESAVTPATLRTHSNQGGVSFYDLGISSTRIMAVNIFVDYGSQPITSSTSDDLVPPSYTATNGYQFDYVLNGNIIEIKNHPTNSVNILGKYVRIFITYRE